MPRYALRGQLQRDFYLRSILGTIPLRNGVYHLPGVQFPLRFVVSAGYSETL